MRILYDSKQAQFKSPFGTLTPGESCVLHIHIPSSVQARQVLCVTVEFQTVGDDTTPADNCVTVRDRDTMEQVRIPIDQLKDYIARKCEF